MTDPLRGLDLRLPIGGLFTVLGVLLVAYGLVTGGDAAMYERSLGRNINVSWGAVMTAFGVLFLLLARRARRRAAAGAAADADLGDGATRS
jgi:hypothetical protein